MRTSDAGIRLIKNFEGLRLRAYLDAVGVLTVGWGHTGPDVEEGMEITEGQAEILLRRDLERFERAVENAVLIPVTQAQFDALVSFTFNLGSGALRRSTLLRLLNAGDVAGAAGQFERWVKAGGKTLSGLVRRRQRERELFET